MLRAYESKKVVHAEPMTSRMFVIWTENNPQANFNKGVDAADDQDGFRVVYDIDTDTEYHSWCPEAQFRKGNKLIPQSFYSESINKVSKMPVDFGHIPGYLKVSESSMKKMEALQDGLTPKVLGWEMKSRLGKHEVTSDGWPVIKNILVAYDPSIYNEEEAFEKIAQLHGDVMGIGYTTGLGLCGLTYKTAIDDNPKPAVSIDVLTQMLADQMGSPEGWPTLSGTLKRRYEQDLIVFNSYDGIEQLLVIYPSHTEQLQIDLFVYSVDIGSGESLRSVINRIGTNDQFSGFKLYAIDVNANPNEHGIHRQNFFHYIETGESLYNCKVTNHPLV